MDDDPRYTYQAWHLARSLMEHCGAGPSVIHVQCTPEVDARRRRLFGDLGCTVHEIQRFGDGRFCNKLNQLDSFRGLDFDLVVLLDTDTIATADLRPFLSDTEILGKIVDAANPPIAILQEIAAASGLQKQPMVCRVDHGGAKETFYGNCNGGFYSVPRRLCEILSAEWRRWALWLLANNEPLRRAGRAIRHVDQVSFWLAIQHANLPFKAAPSNVNYFSHFDAKHEYFDATLPIALLHYHACSLNVLGLLEAPAGLPAAGHDAVARANAQIGKGFDNRVFWEMRYRHFPERGSGVGSRGDNLLYKRQLLKEQGVETASSVLDVGCGDLEVVKALAIASYVGVDQSQETLTIARNARPDWVFELAPCADVPAAGMVLCLEVLIHQETEDAYRALIDFLANKTLGTLLASGFPANEEAIEKNPMIFFYEPLENSLRRTGRFSSIKQIGAHTNVTIYRCDV
ncbi:MAG: class I SAM-dependent methyltransferase [Beijerinckiaceae bacterium]